MIRPVDIASLPDCWPRVLPVLQPAIDHGRRAAAAEVYRWLLAGDYQLWVCERDGEIEAAATTAISIYPGSKWLTVVHCGGRHMERWLIEGMATIEAWAAANDCAGVEIIGRQEWTRVLGYDAGGTIAEKRLNFDRRAAE